MIVIGMNFARNSAGGQVTTLHVADDFDAYNSDVSAGRTCVGKKVENIFVGDYDCSNISVGMEIEVYYGKAVTTPKGTFQTIKKIEVLSGHNEYDEE